MTGMTELLLILNFSNFNTIMRLGEVQAGVLDKNLIISAVISEIYVPC